MTVAKIIEILPLMAEDLADGASYSVLRLCESLVELGVDITLANCDCTLIKSPPNFLKRFSLGIGPKKLCRSPLMHNWLTSLAQANEISLIHSQGLWTMPNIYPTMLSKKHAIPIIVSPLGSLAPWAFKSGSPVKKIFWAIYQHKALQMATCFHATGESEYNDIRRMGFKQPVAIIPNGIDIPDQLPQQQQQLRTLLFLGRINPIKGLDILLPAWRNIQDKFPQWQLVIAGPDSKGYLKEIQKMAINLQLKRVTFPGLLVKQVKWQAYQNAELFILPSYTENFGETIAESLVSGTPVITTQGTPWAALETHNAGWWIDIGIDKLTQCLNHTLNLTPTELSIMGENGKAWMKHDLSWKKTGQMMAETYAWIINGGIPPSWVHLE